MTAQVAGAEPPASEDDARFMALAQALGRRGLGNTWPNPAVGAVVVKDGVIVGRGWTAPGGRPHAEPQALKRAGRLARGATLYVTLEPCSHTGQTPPCVDAISRAGIARVVSAMADTNPEISGAGHAELAGRKIQVDVGLGGDEARRTHAGHVMRMSAGRPLVTLKLAVSADDKVGLAGHRVTITGEAAQRRVFRMRAEHDAILVGINTVLTDNPALTCRLPGMLENSPVRVVLDRKLQLPLSCHVAATARETPTWVFTSPSASTIAEEILQQRGLKVFRVNDTAGGLDVKEVLATLAREGITRLMVEGGPAVASSFVAAGVADAAVIFRATKTIGENGISALRGQPLSSLTGATGMHVVTDEPCGLDRVTIYERG